MMKYLLLLLALITPQAHGDGTTRNMLAFADLEIGGIHDCFRCMITVEEVEFEDGHEEVDFMCNTGKDMAQHKDSTYSINLNNEFLFEWGAEISKSPMWFCVHGGVLNVEKGHIDMPSHASIVPVFDDETRRLRRLTESAKTGNRTVLVVRLFADDAPAEMTHDEVRGHVFSEGPLAKSASIATQFYKCSGGSLDMVPVQGLPGVKNGIFDLNYGKTKIAGKDISGDLSFRNQMSDDLHDYLQLDYLNDKIDHVLYIIPQEIVRSGKTTWSGFANWYRVYFRANRARVLSSNMHEVGHTLGLKHAGEDGRKYMDKTGYMGVTYRQEDTPLMCFNGAHNHQMGWFAKHELYLSPEDGDWAGNLVTFVDYEKVSVGGVVLITIDDMHIQYNRKKLFNVGTNKAPDMVTITQSSSSTSWFKVGLSPGESHEEYGLTIRFCEATINNKEADVAKMSISPTANGKNYCLGGKPEPPAPADDDDDEATGDDDWYYSDDDDDHTDDDT